MLPLDVIGLANASPVEIDNRQAYPLGRMLFVALQGNESRTELMTILKKGTPRLGGTNPETRKAAAILRAEAMLAIPAVRQLARATRMNSTGVGPLSSAAKTASRAGRTLSAGRLVTDLSLIIDFNWIRRIEADHSVIFNINARRAIAGCGNDVAIVKADFERARF